MLLVLCKVRKGVKWEKGILHWDAAIFGADFSELLEWTESSETRKPRRQAFTLAGAADASSSLLLMQENQVCVPHVVEVIKLCTCPRQLMARDKWKPLRMKMDGHLFSYVMSAVRSNDTYRKSVIRTFLESDVVRRKGLIHGCRQSTGSVQHLQLEIHLASPAREIMDIAWSNRMQMLIEERVELENVMAWLSTLGGAFSALGDSFRHCAEVAGKISGQQMKIALKLGDPITASKCLVYYAISLVQQGCLKQCEQIVRQQYSYAISLPENSRDIRLVNMCKGVWAKLTYLHSQKSLQRLCITSRSSHSPVARVKEIPNNQIGGDA